MVPETQKQIIEAIEAAEGIRFAPHRCQSLGGGDINAAFVLEDENHSYFAKVNTVDYLDMMLAERESLNLLRKADALRVPRPVEAGVAGGEAFLILEYCPMQSHGSDSELARGLAKLHGNRSPSGQFGWHADNFIGTSPQYNQWHDSWPEFWLEQRLRPQLELAYRNGHAAALQPLAHRLERRLPEIWGDHDPAPSLLHGDLWGGNAAFLESGEPVIYDPASYYGDRETDLALTRLFGGFGPAFYEEYQRLWPLEPGHEERQQLYNLYHLLNHLNLFGGGYLGPCQRSINALL